MSYAEPKAFRLHFTTLNSACQVTQIHCVITGDDVLQASSGVRPHSPSVSRAVSLNTSPSFPPPTTPLSLPVFFLPCQAQHWCQFVCVSISGVSGESPKKLVASNVQQQLWNGICTFKMGCSNTCEVERFSNSIGTAQWILGEIAFSPE